MKLRLVVALATTSLLTPSWPAFATGPTIGAAPTGDPKVVASKIIKYNFPECKRVSNATRSPDGSIRAKCGGSDYLVFTMFNPKENKTLELALNCTAAKNMLNVSC